MLSVFSFYFTFLSPADPLINDMVDLTLIFLSNTDDNFPNRSLFSLELFLFDETITQVGSSVIVRVVLIIAC